MFKLHIVMWCKFSHHIVMNPILPQNMADLVQIGLKQVGLRRNNSNLELPDAGTDWASGGIFWFKQDGFETLI